MSRNQIDYLECQSAECFQQLQWTLSQEWHGTVFAFPNSYNVLYLVLEAVQWKMPACNADHQEARHQIIILHENRFIVARDIVPTLRKTCITRVGKLGSGWMKDASELNVDHQEARHQIISMETGLSLQFKKMCKVSEEIASSFSSNIQRAAQNKCYSWHPNS